MRRACTVLVLVVVSCSSGTTRSQAGFCKQLTADRDLLIAPITQPATVAPLLARYERLDLLAPEAIRDEWHELTVLIQTVAASDVRLPGKQADLVQLAYTTDRAIQAIVSYGRDVCDVELSVKA